MVSQLVRHLSLSHRSQETQRSHPQTNRFNVTLQFPVMQNTAAVVFQGEAGGVAVPASSAPPGPICSLGRHFHSGEARAPPLVTLCCPRHYSSVCKTFPFPSEASAQCSAAWSVPVSSLACPFRRFVCSLMKITPQATEILA